MLSRFSTSGALWKCAIPLFCLMLATVAPAQQLPIDTIPSWDGSTYISSFGVVDTATYGQTITVPTGATPMTSFSFEIGNCGADVTFRGEVYAWNGTMATGTALFESAPITLTASAAFQLVTVSTGNVALGPGTYVLFVSTSRDQAGAPSSACRFGSVVNTAYTGGNFVFINNGTNPGSWTTSTWSSISQDLAFRVGGLQPGSSVTPVAGAPAASTISLIVGGMALMLLAAFALTRVRQHT